MARSREKNCADRAKDLLDEMGRLYNEGDTELLPHAVSFGAIINAVSPSVSFGLKAMMYVSLRLSKCLHFDATLNIPS